MLRRFKDDIFWERGKQTIFLIFKVFIWMGVWEVSLKAGMF